MRGLRAVPAVMRPSHRWVRRLRAIDRDLVVVSLGQGQWAVGVVKPRWSAPDGNYQRRATGESVLQEERAKAVPHWPTLRLGLLMAEGFGLLQLVECDGDPALAGFPVMDPVTGRKVAVSLEQWLRRADWEWQHDRARRERELLAAIASEAGLDKAKAAVQDWARTEGRGVFRHVFQKRRSVTMGRRAGLNPKRKP